MDAVACWDGSTKRFIVKRKGNVSCSIFHSFKEIYFDYKIKYIHFQDPGSRAWITSIIKSTAGSASPSSSTYERKSDNARYKNLQGTSSSHGRLMSVDSQRLVEMVTISGILASLLILYHKFRSHSFIQHLFYLYQMIKNLNLNKRLVDLCFNGICCVCFIG